MPRHNKGLTDKQRLFVAEYLTDFNATAAARRAGYSQHTAKNIGHLNLKKPEIQEAISAAVEAKLEPLGITAEHVLQEIARLGFSNMLDYIRITGDGDPFVDLSNLTREQAAAIQEVTVDDIVEGRGEDSRIVRRVKFKLADKKGNLELLGRHLKLFTDKVEHGGDGGGPIQIIEVGIGDDDEEDLEESEYQDCDGEGFEEDEEG